jgi:hypothetical protein
MAPSIASRWSRRRAGPCAQLARALDHEAVAVRGDLRGGLGHRRGADLGGHVTAVDAHAIGDLQPQAPRELRGRLGGLQRGQPTQRYIAPVSRNVKPSRAATARATVDLPAPAGPSMAMTIAPSP